MGSTLGLDRTTARKPTAEDNWQLANATARIAEMRVPKLHGNNRHEHLYYAMFDGSNQTRDRAVNAEEGRVRTAIGYFSDALEAEGPKHKIAVGYQTGVGREGSGLERAAGMLNGAGAVEKVERQYQALCEQMAEWRKQDPQAQLRVVGMGYSRGGDQAAAFLRLVHERGVLMPGSKNQYLVSPGKTPQAAILLDPVASGELEKTDRRMPASALFGVQVVSRDERRVGFESNPVLADGLSRDKRFLSVTVPGGHGDTAHGHARDAAAVRVENALVDVINGFSGKHVINNVPQSKGAYLMLHDTEWRVPTSMNALLGDKDPGSRDAQMSLAPGEKCAKEAAACYRADPVDPALQRQFQYKPQTHAPVRETNGPGHVRLDHDQRAPDVPGVKPVLNAAIAMMDALKIRHPELQTFSAPQLAVGAMNQWKASGGPGMFTEVTLTRGADGRSNVVLSDAANAGVAARRSAVALDALTRVGFEEGLAHWVQNEKQAQTAEQASAQQVHAQSQVLKPSLVV